jgi:hypothetical protein
MLPVFTTPLAFLGLLTVPALVAIYLLHNRSRPVPVSSLLLWVDARVAPDGGRRVDRLRPPPLFWLELFLLLLLVLAAAGPHVPTAAGARPLVVVLDDSFSMQAGEPDSPRKRAAEALRDELRRAPRDSVRLVLAGDRPQLLGEGTHRGADVEPLLAGWTCQSPIARLDAAVALALELGGNLATVLVLTDHAPDPPPDTGRLRWWAFGTARPNWAFVNASRTPGPRGDRLLLEVANLATEPRTTTLRIDAGREVRNAEVRLNARETHRVVLELPADPAPAVRASVGADDLPFDNTVTLVPAGRPLIRYDLRLGEPGLRAIVDRAVRATGAATPAADRPHLVFLDATAEAPEGDDTWVVRVLAEPDAEAYTGPFVLDRAHPLTDGLSPNGVVWGGGTSPLPGSPVVMAGNVPLVTDAELPSGRHELRLRLRPDLSTLTESPAWPAFVWNLIHWRSAHLPGLDRANVRVGEDVTWTLTTQPGTVEVTRPGGEVVTVPAHGRRATVRADRSGVYSLRAGAETAEFAANPLTRDESDLTACATGRWGDDRDPTTLRLEYRDVAWALALLAAAGLVLHGWLVSRASGSGGRR